MQPGLMFDATQIEPNQGGEAHPVGKFAAQITNTATLPTKNDAEQGMLRIQYTTQMGTIDDNFQLWNKNPQAVDIAQKQLSAVCHATGIFQLKEGNHGAELRGARLMIEVGPQIDKQTKQPNGYVEVKKVYDANGNLPGKAPAQTAQPQPGPAAWNAAPATTTAPTAPNPNPAWGQQQPQPQPGPQPATGGWQQNPAASSDKPAWAR